VLAPPPPCRRYFELLVAFDTVDVSDDRRLDLTEFINALPLLAGWGISVTDPEAEFAAIDANRSGNILFDEFASFALTRGLVISATSQADTIDYAELTKKHAAIVKARSKGNVSARGVGSPRTPRRHASLIELLDVSASMSLATLVERLPCGTNDVQKQARAELFDKLDAANTGALVAADVDAGLRDLLARLGRRESDPPVPAIDAAFECVTQYRMPDKRYLRRADFRLYLCNLKWYGSPFGALGIRGGASSLTSTPGRHSGKLPPMRSTAVA
jgi:hypothetical protein